MAASYKLTYFNIKGRAELSRLIFAVAGAEYEDNRIQGKDWPALKPTMPFGKIPVLAVNGKVFAQSFAIANFLANQFGLRGDNNMEIFEIDQILELIKDFLFFLNKSFDATDNDVKAQFMKEAVEVHSLALLERLEKLIQTSTTGFFVGSKLSLADLAVFDIMDWITDRNASAVDGYPGLKAFREKIGSIERIKNYLDTRNNSA